MSIFKAVGSNLVSQPPDQGVVQPLEQRLQIDHLISPSNPLAKELTAGKDVVEGLSKAPKSLPPHYFYDDRGSQLFEQICELPEYYLTRTETAILQQYASAIAQITGPCELVELGSGSAIKTRILLDAYAALDQPLHYMPIDVSAGILESSARDLLIDYPTLQVHGLVSTYELALAKLEPAQLPTRMICFLGSSLGNLTPAECEVFFSQVKASLKPGEYFLLGFDLQKSPEVLEAAYDDSQEITAAFNLNMLAHLNGRFQGDFDISQFEHVAFYNQSLHQIEIYLKSLRSQTVHLRSLNLTLEFAAGETIHTEISRKFDLSLMQQDLKAKGLNPIQAWSDPKQWFGLVLCQV
ncbi:MAG: L-histidine N(alpha)-methyltransferase [Trichocoleus desertorum ATA4-8-CV12]|jgi:dimethylhistidine N-methyltransferase|nr:L-histidine N(alpha)-methyltransferase [Trichocoleus desertorum ATA4-8-CV12]